MPKYGKTSRRKVRKAMREFKSRKLKSGRSHRTVKNRRQAIAIGLSQARRSGAKVPPKKGRRRTTARPKKGRRRTTARNPARKTARKRSKRTR